MLMLFGAYNHLANPDFYLGFIPENLPKAPVHYLTALVEFIIGSLILIPKYRRLGALSFIALMLAFLPIHIWDLLKDMPAIGSKQAAIIRLIVQFVFIAIAYFIFKRSNPNK